MALHTGFRGYSVHAATLVGGALLLSATIALRAEQGAPQSGARPLVPMTASTIARDLASHIGENVSMMATVETVLTKTVFTVDQDKSKATGQEVIVIAPTLQTAPDTNAYVTVQGEVFKFDPAEIAKRNKAYKLDLSPEQVAKYAGKPAVMATVVVNTALVDLAKKPIVPPTPAEVAMSAAMKVINSAMGVVRAGLEKPDAAQLKEQAAALKKAFMETEATFKTLGRASAITMSAEAVKHATAMETAVAAGKWEDVKTAASGITPLCAQCHGEHRDRMDDGSYRIRSGG